jgi:hypothetical protein
MLGLTLCKRPGSKKDGFTILKEDPATSALSCFWKKEKKPYRGEKSMLQQN